MEKATGKKCVVVDLGVFEIQPGGGTQFWHHDLEGVETASEFAEHSRLATLMIPMSDQWSDGTSCQGSTAFVEGSHVNPRFLGTHGQLTVTQPVMKDGDVSIFGGKLVHLGGANACVPSPFVSHKFSCASAARSRGSRAT